MVSVGGEPSCLTSFVEETKGVDTRLQPKKPVSFNKSKINFLWKILRPSTD